MSQKGITVFFVLQNRTNIVLVYGQQQTSVQAAGGKAVVYHMDITLELTKKDSITKTIKGHDKPIPYGSECFIKANKNRYAPPMIPMVLHVIFGKGISNTGTISSALILNGKAKLSGRKYSIDYQGETYEFSGKPKFDEFVKEHLEYYKNIVESCGGIKLIPDTEKLPVVEVTESQDDVIDEVDNEEEEIEEGSEEGSEEESLESVLARE